MTKKKRTNKAVKYLDFTANHFVHRDWNYTRDTDIENILYTKGNRETFKQHISSAFRFLLTSKKHGVIYDNSLWGRIGMFFYCLKRNVNTPDGQLDDGNILVMWEESGEYLQMVQPSVGALLANFLKAEPEHPHAKLIIAELERILNGYSKRLKSGEISEEEHDGK